MKTRYILFSLLLFAVLSGCGLKRNLELPEHQKHHKTDADSQAVQPAAATPASTATTTTDAPVAPDASTPPAPATQK